MPAELKSCPFCGSVATVFRAAPAWGVQCANGDDCGGRMLGFTERKFAIEAWNRRADIKEGDLQTAQNSAMDAIVALKNLVAAVKSIPNIGEAVSMDVRIRIIDAENVLQQHHSA